MTAWESREGSPFPFGASWISDEAAYNIALYSKHAESVTLHLYRADDCVTPSYSRTLNYLTSKSGPIWHCRISADQADDARFYAYQVTGPSPSADFDWHTFNAHSHPVRFGIQEGTPDDWRGVIDTSQKSPNDILDESQAKIVNSHYRDVPPHAVVVFVRTKGAESESIMGETLQTKKLHLPELLAMGIGGMIGGGIFSVLGMAVGISGHAVPLAFVVGSLVALAAGYSYVKLALSFRNDGASFTYLDAAFPSHPNVAGIAGWTVVVGYVGTLALYAFTFGAYGAHLLGSDAAPAVRMVLSTGVLLFFMGVNLRGVQASGRSEDLIVLTKVILLALFAVAGFFTIQHDHLFPVFETGTASVFIAGATVFVAFEGFQLITNAVMETENPDRNIPRGIYGSIAITALIYFGVALVAVGNMTLGELTAAKEYALAVAAQPALGNAGPVLVDLAALLATASAINATAFGASRMMAEMGMKQRMPAAFSFRSRTDVPWLAVVSLTVLAMGFTVFSGLETIATFSSLTFLLVSMAVSVANLKLRNHTQSKAWLVLLGIGLMLTTTVLLVLHLWRKEPQTFFWIAGFYTAIAIAEIVFIRRNKERASHTES